MRVSHKWLQELCPHDLDASALAHALTFQVCPVEGIEPLADGDTALELEVTFNRGDLLSHIGVAREVAAATGGAVREPAAEPTGDPARAVGALAAVEVHEPDLCPRYTARVIEGVRVAPSPAWLQARLEAAGVRPVNTIVDVTNLVMLECGQPLHAFDLDKLAGARIVVRRAAEGERFVAIDQSAHTLTPDALVIADGERPVALAGVMGGLDTEIGNGTTRVLLESAAFDAVNVRRTVRRTGLKSASSHRFERGPDPSRVEWASRRAAALIVELAGGHLADGVLDVDAGTLPGPRALTMRLARLERVCGFAIPGDTAARLLTALGMEVTARGDAESADAVLDVVVPTSRHEIAREIDLIEEVLRAYGYANVPDATSLPIAVAGTDLNARSVRAIKDVLVGAGYREICSLSFVGERPLDDPPLFSSIPARRVANPVRQETPCLRRSLFGPLTAAKKVNQDRGTRSVKLFEVSSAYVPRAGTAADTDEWLMLGLLADDDIFGVKGVVERLALALGLEGRVRLEPVRNAGSTYRVEKVESADHEGAFDALEVAHIVLAGAGRPTADARPSEAIGWLGRLSAKAAQHLDLGRDRPVVACLLLEPLVWSAQLNRTYRALSPFPEVARDLAVVVPSEGAYVGDLLAEAEALRAATPALAGVQLLSVFEGDDRSLPRGQKSVAIRLSCQAPDRTLTGAEADAIREALKVQLATRFAASFRE